MVPETFLMLSEAEAKGDTSMIENLSFPSSSTHSSAPSSAKKIKLKESHAPQKINKHLSTTRSERKQKYSKEKQQYQQRHRTQILPESISVNQNLTREQTIDWMHDVSMESISAYSYNKIADESNAVKTDFGLELGFVNENENTNLPSLDQVLFSNSLAGFGVTGDGVGENMDNSATDPNTSSPKKFPNPVNETLNFINQISNQTALQTNTFLMEHLVGTDSSRLNKIIELKALQNECQSIELETKKLQDLHKTFDMTFPDYEKRLKNYKESNSGSRESREES